MQSNVKRDVICWYLYANIKHEEHGGEWLVRSFTTYKGVYVSVQCIDPQLTMMVTFLTLKASPSVPRLSFLLDMLHVLGPKPTHLLVVPRHEIFQFVKKTKKEGSKTRVSKFLITTYTWWNSNTRRWLGEGGCWVLGVVAQSKWAQDPWNIFTNVFKQDIECDLKVILPPLAILHWILFGGFMEFT